MLVKSSLPRICVGVFSACGGVGSDSTVSCKIKLRIRLRALPSDELGEHLLT